MKRQEKEAGNDPIIKIMHLVYVAGIQTLNLECTVSFFGIWQAHLLFCVIYLHKNIINVSCVQIHVLFSLIHYARVLLNLKPQNYYNYFYQSILCLVLNLFFGL